MDVGSRDTIPPSEHGFAGLVFAGDKDLKPAYAPLYLRSEESILNSIRLKKEQLVLDHEFDRIIGSSRPLTEVLDLVTKLENLAKAAKPAWQIFCQFPYFQDFASGQRLARRGAVLHIEPAKPTSGTDGLQA